jgi:hypothetical protein
VKATRGHFLDAIGHRSHASENPSKDLHDKGIARLRQTSPMLASQTGSYTLTVEKEAQNHPHDFQKSLYFWLFRRICGCGLRRRTRLRLDRRVLPPAFTITSPR